jgi:glycogen operon protein
MRDLVSYNGKHNDENGEDNRDGSDNNLSYNYGTEGVTNDPIIKAIRDKQLKNFFATMMVSLGTPMILGGDEIGRTQNGNNNAYCQDNEISWYDWSLFEQNQELFRFVKEMIAFRLRHPGFMRPEFYTGRGGNYNAIPDISWFDDKGNVPDWEKIGYFLALRVDGRKAETLADRDDNDFYLMFNSGQEIHPFKLSELKKKEWYRVIDTGLNHPNDILPVGYEKSLPSQNTYPVKGRSMAILISKDISNG